MNMELIKFLSCLVEDINWEIPLTVFLILFLSFLTVSGNDCSSALCSAAPNGRRWVSTKCRHHICYDQGSVHPRHWHSAWAQHGSQFTHQICLTHTWRNYVQSIWLAHFWSFWFCSKYCNGNIFVCSW